MSSFWNYIVFLFTPGLFDGPFSAFLLTCPFCLYTGYWNPLLIIPFNVLIAQIGFYINLSYSNDPTINPITIQNIKTIMGLLGVSSGICISMFYTQLHWSMHLFIPIFISWLGSQF